MTVLQLLVAEALPLAAGCLMLPRWSQTGVVGSEGQEISPLGGDQRSRLTDSVTRRDLDPGEDRLVTKPVRAAKVAVNLWLCSGTTRSS